jgi:hypothetical protein
MLQRNRNLYANTTETDALLDRAKPSYMGGILEMASLRLYSHWGALTEALRTGEPQNEARRGGDFFDALYSDPERLRGFLQAMTGISTGTSKALWMPTYSIMPAIPGRAAGRSRRSRARR